MLWLIGLLPAKYRNALATALAAFYCRKRGTHYHYANVNIEACYPELNTIGRAAFYQRYLTSLYQTMLLTPRQWWGSDKSIKAHSTLHDLSILDSAVATGRPVVLLVSHSVALDAGMMAVAPYHRLLGIYKPFKNSVVDWLVYRSRNRFGAIPLARGAGFRGMIKGMKNGAVLCYLSDEDLGPKGAVFAPFFKRQKATLAMLPRLVKHTDAIVVPMTACYEASTDQVHVHFLPALENYPVADEVENATQMNAAIERSVKLCPEQYFWKMLLFRTCPDGGVSRYDQITRGDISPADL